MSAGRDQQWPARRTAARLTAVQALYQIDQTGASTDAVVAEFLEFRIGDGLDAGPGIDPDPALFSALVRGVGSRLTELDGTIRRFLAGQWSLERLEAVLRAILRAGTYELRFCSGVPARVVVDEYVDLAHAFFSGGEAGLVNGVLDSAARSLRTGEFGESGGDPATSAEGAVSPN